MCLHKLTCVLGRCIQQAALMDGNSVTDKLGNVWTALAVRDKHRYMSADGHTTPVNGYICFGFGVRRGGSVSRDCTI